MSRSFFVEKTSGGFRLVLDLKFVNLHFEFPKVKFENLSVLRYAPTTTTHAISVDISDAYHHLRIHPALEKYFQFKIDGRFYQAIGLPFGWSPAPGCFTKFIKQILNALRNPSMITSPLHWIIRDQASELGHYFVSGFLDDLLGIN